MREAEKNSEFCQNLEVTENSNQDSYQIRMKKYMASISGSIPIETNHVQDIFSMEYQFFKTEKDLIHQHEFFRVKEMVNRRYFRVMTIAINEQLRNKK